LVAIAEILRLDAVRSDYLLIRRGIGKANPFFQLYWRCALLSNTPTPVKLIFEYHESDERKNGTSIDAEQMRVKIKTGGRS
jgi:hypothetical protein